MADDSQFLEERESFKSAKKWLKLINKNFFIFIAKINDNVNEHLKMLSVG